MLTSTSNSQIARMMTEQNTNKTKKIKLVPYQICLLQVKNQNW